MSGTLLARLRAEMSSEADASRAAGMQDYMKSTMPYHGLVSPKVRAITRRVFADEHYSACGDWRAAITYHLAKNCRIGSAPGLV